VLQALIACHARCAGIRRYTQGYAAPAWGGPSFDARFHAAMRKVFDIPLDDGSQNPRSSADLKGFCVNETKRVSNLHNLFPEYRAEFRSALRSSHLATSLLGLGCAFTLQPASTAVGLVQGSHLPKRVQQRSKIQQLLNGTNANLRTATWPAVLARARCGGCCRTK